MSSNNTYFTLSGLKSSDVSEGTAFLVQDLVLSDGVFYWTLGNYSGESDDIDIVESDNESLSVGAWVRQATTSITTRLSDTDARRRTQSAKNGDWISVRDYSAPFDGVNSDNEAFEKALLHNDVVHVPEGTYVLNDLAMLSGRTLIGAGPKTILKRGTGYRPLAGIGIEDFTIENLKIDGTGTADNLTTYQSCRRGLLRNLHGTGANGHGFLFDECRDMLLETVDMYETGALECAAIYFGNAEGRGTGNIVRGLRGRDLMGRLLYAIGQDEMQVSDLYGRMTWGEIFLLEDCAGCLVTRVTHRGPGSQIPTGGDGMGFNGDCYDCTLDTFYSALSAGHAVSLNGGWVDPNATPRVPRSGASYCTVKNGIVIAPNEGAVICSDQGVATSVPFGNIIEGVIARNAGQKARSEIFGCAGGRRNTFRNCEALDNQSIPTSTHGFLEITTSYNVASDNYFEGRVYGNFITAPISTAAPSTVAINIDDRLAASVTYDPPGIATGAQASKTFSVPGARMGDVVAVGFSTALGGLELSAEVSAADAVTAYFRNRTGALIDLSSGTLTAKIIKG